MEEKKEKEKIGEKIKIEGKDKENEKLEEIKDKNK